MDPAFYEAYYRHEERHWWFRWRFELITGIIRDLFPDRRPRILDAGCGTGQMLRRLEGVGEVVGIDSSSRAIAFAASRGARRLVLGSVTRPPFVDATFDCVVSLDVIEHVDDDRGILEGLYQVVRPGGYLIVTVPAFQALWSQHDEINHHKRRYTVDEIRNLIDAAGFSVDRVTYCNAAFFFPVLMARKVKNLRRRIGNGAENGHEAMTSDLADYPGVVNEAFFQVMRGENRLLRRVNLPFGVSILAIARRPERAALAPAAAGVLVTG